VTVEPAARPLAGHPPARRSSARGVTGRGVVVLILVLSAVVGLLDVVIGGHRGHLFAIAFVASSIAGALLVRRRDISTAMIAPPLIYCVLIGALSLIDTKDLTGGLATREGFYIANAFVTGAPTIWTGTAAAALIGWYRLRAAQPSARGRRVPA